MTIVQVTQVQVVISQELLIGSLVVQDCQILQGFGNLIPVLATIVRSLFVQETFVQVIFVQKVISLEPLIGSWSDFEC